MLCTLYKLLCPICGTRLKLDNSTAVAYINKMGGIKSPSLNSLSRTLWEWRDERGIIISAQHIPGKENLVADSSSRQFSSNLELSVDIGIFNQISNMTFAPDVDLFASRQIVLFSGIQNLVLWLLMLSLLAGLI